MSGLVLLEMDRPAGRLTVNRAEWHNGLAPALLEASTRRMVGLLAQAILALVVLPVPVIAAVQGQYGIRPLILERFIASAWGPGWRGRRLHRGLPATRPAG